MNDNLLGVQQCIHYDFSQVKLLAIALTHTSFANEQDGEAEDNERLEFLGDAVLELTISEEAYLRYPNAPEGQLTRVRSRLVKEKTLAEAARSLTLDRFVSLGKGEEAQGGRDRDSLLSDALEAVFGAVFLDGGFDAAKSVILRVFEARWPDSPDLPGAKDYKSQLQEVTQRLFRERPTYTLKGTSGPEHEKVFTVELALPDGRIFPADGGSVKRAEQSAARAALEALEGDSPVTSSD